MENTELIDRLADAVIDRMQPPVPMAVRLWDAKTIAAYLHRSPAVVMERIVTLPGFPPPFRLPTQTEKSKGQPLWKAVEVVAWVEGHRATSAARGRTRKV